MNSIKSTIALWRYHKAVGLHGSRFQSLALLQIRKAVAIEPDEKIKARYLLLQSEIEMEIGKTEIALETLTSAKNIIAKHKEYWTADENNQLVLQIEETFKLCKMKKR